VSHNELARIVGNSLRCGPQHTLHNGYHGIPEKKTMRVPQMGFLQMKEWVIFGNLMELKLTLI